MVKKKIGLIINPIAGMGGSVGLKGTDGDIYRKALKLGAEPVTPKRVDDLLNHIKNKEDILLFVAPSKMGADIVKDKDIDFKIIGEIDVITSSEDTKRIAKMILEQDIDLLIFSGGDGTARDIFDAIQMKIPVIAIPSGVKMFSAVFSINPKAAAKMLDAFLIGTDLIEREILDINEELYRTGILDSRLYGYLKIPNVKNLFQAGKHSPTVNKTANENKQEISKFIVENMEDNVLYLLGPGTTVKAIADYLKISKTLLGIDALYNREIVEKDINEERILALLNIHSNAIIIVSPIGGQGFIFGRGNKQFTPKVIEKVGKKNIKIVAISDKMKDLSCIRIDTGEIRTDNMLKGHIKIIVGYEEYLIIKVE